MRLALVVQRYGDEITGGAEFHCRLVAEHLAPRHHVSVVTTCAQDYVTWANAYRRGICDVGGIAVWRFPVSRSRDPHRFGRLQERVFHRDHDEREALAWLDAQGPHSPAMLDWVRRYRDRFDGWICFSYRYWTTFHVLRAVRGKGILVPTAEPDPAIDLPLYRDNFRTARAIVYNSPEERQMIAERAGVEDVPGDVVGVGIQEPPTASAERFRQRTGIDDPFLLYVGRIDRNKGCDQLFDHFLRAHDRLREALDEPPLLVLAGTANLEIPEHAGVRYLGRVDEQLKYDALAACAALLMPSFFESLSMVLLEAWAMSRPVLVNGHCDVLQGQVQRSDGGLYYREAGEFVECARLLLGDARLADRLGEAGRRYYERHYVWPVIEAKYERLLRDCLAAPATGAGATARKPGAAASGPGPAASGREG